MPNIPLNNKTLHFWGSKSHPDYQRNLFLLKTFAHPFGWLVKEGVGSYQVFWTENISDIKPTPSEGTYLKQITILARPVHSTSISEHRILSSEKWVTQFLKTNTLNLMPEISFEFSDCVSQEFEGLFTFDILSILSDILWKTTDQLPQYIEAARWAKYHGLDQALELQRRPLVDNWMDLFFNWLSPIKSDNLPIHRPQIWLTHDVDVLEKFPVRSQLKAIAKWPIQSFRSINAVQTQFSELWGKWAGKGDPYHQIPAILGLNRKHTACFFFLGSQRDHLAKRYSLDSAHAQKALGEVANGNALVGWHGIKWLQKNTGRMQKEYNHLSRTYTKVLDIHQQKKTFAGTFKSPNYSINIHRSHFLVWEPIYTSKTLKEFGINIDSTMGYNDGPGFRCGTTRPFFWWDDNNNQPIHLLEIPLITADFQLGSMQHFSIEDAWCKWKSIWDNCQRPGAVLTHLHHNNAFYEKDNPGHVQWYNNMLDFIESQGVCDFEPQSQFENLRQTLLS